MLPAWLDEASRRSLADHQRQGRAFALPSIAALRPELFDARVLDEVLSSEPDLLLVRDGAHLHAPAPRRAAQVAAALAHGVGLVIRRAERHAPGLRALAEQFAASFAAEVHIQLFVTPQKTRGFAWHFDHEDVVILQTGGEKTYYLRENTVLRELPASPDFTLIRAEKSPLAACTLQAGDALYVPRGMWHMGKAERESWSISLGMLRQDSPVGSGADRLHRRGS